MNIIHCFRPIICQLCALHVVELAVTYDVHNAVDEHFARAVVNKDGQIGRRWTIWHERWTYWQGIGAWHIICHYQGENAITHTTPTT